MLSHGSLNKYISSKNEHTYNLNGVDNSFSVAQIHSQLKDNFSQPALIIVPGEKEYLEVKNALEFLNNSINIKYLPHFSSQMYSEVTPPVRISNQRLNWINCAQNVQKFDDTVFIATLPSLLQSTMPIEEFIELSFNLSNDQTLPVNLSKTLLRLGYNQSHLVEDPGTFALRGGILDIFSPAHDQPIRIELFGDIIESIRFFNPENQKTLSKTDAITIIPAKETIYSDDNRQLITRNIKMSAAERDIEPSELTEIVQDIVHWKYFLGCEYYINYFYKNRTLPLDYFSEELFILNYNQQLQLNIYDKFISDLKEHYKYNFKLSHLLPNYNEVFCEDSKKACVKNSKQINLSQIQFENFHESSGDDSFNFITNELNDFKNKCKSLSSTELGEYLTNKISSWKKSSNLVIFSSTSETELKQFLILAEDNGISINTIDSLSTEVYESQRSVQEKNEFDISFINKESPQSLHFKNDNIIFITLTDLFGKKKSRTSKRKTNSFKKAKSLHFADLKANDYIVHKEHGVGIYKGLTVMDLGGAEAEFIQIEYKDKDKLYLPIYRIGQIQKFTGGGQNKILDKLGGKNWAKTKTKVKNKLKDIASDLLKLYAERSQSTRPPLPPPSAEFNKFEKLFPFTETEDQLNAINHIINDQTLEKPMDRLICGDVGFGKTEVAMRAAFRSAINGKQVAIIAPTTILTFQHFETFKNRFQHWPLKIVCLNRFISNKEIKKNLEMIKSGEAHIAIGTHRLFSNDVEFSNLGLLVVDEEQKFGVKHKEKIRKLKSSVDTISLSATPIPRTLNMSFLGIRDLSLINTAPVDRLPIRTFVSKYEIHTIKRAIQNEVDRGGQVFFLHNRVNNIETIAQELRDEMPHISFTIGHGQMKETELEKVMVSFYEKKVDVLISTTIIESGMDIPNANTIIINNSQNLGLSQLYQLRGRVGRSTKRAYCYLMVPRNKPLDKQALERLKVIQQNSELGSGITIAQYDLELRGSGDLLGENQSGHINAVGYELYMELLKEAISEQKGEPSTSSQLEPEINLRIPSLFPDKYMSDIRLRLSYYKRLSDIESFEEIDHIEEELMDQFGKPPVQVQNLLGIMLIRLLCKKLCIQDLSQAKKGITLKFTQDTPLSTDDVFKLTSRADEKFKLTPDSKLLIHIKEKSWERIFEELNFLAKKCNLNI